MAVRESPKKTIVIQNGRQNEVAVITYATVSIEHALAVKIHALVVKKEVWQKSVVASQP